MLIGHLLAARIATPFLKRNDRIARVKVSKVAIAVATKSTAQNWMAGLSILLRQPFVFDAQIEVNGF